MKNKPDIDDAFKEIKEAQDNFEKQFEAFFVGNGLVSQKDYDKAIKDKAIKDKK